MKNGNKLILLIILILTFLTGCQALEEFLATEKIDSSEYHNVLGVDLMNKEKYEEAIEKFNKAIEENPNVGAYYNNLSWAYNELEDYELALEYANKSLEYDNITSENYINQGIALYSLNRLDEAKFSIQEALKLDPKNSTAYYGLGEILYYSGFYEEAEEQYKLSLKYSPYDIDSIISIIYCQIHSNKFEEALELIDEYSFQYQSIFEFRKAQGELFEHIKTEAEVEAYYNELVAKFSDEIDAHHALGIYYFYVTYDYDKAVKHFESIIDLPIANVETYDWLAYSYLNVYEYNTALATAQAGLKLDSEYYNIYNTIGDIYYFQDRYLDAITNYEKSISLTTTTSLPYTNHLWALYSAYSYDQCIEKGTEYLNLFSDNAQIYDLIAYSYMDLMDYESAINNFKRSIELDPTDPYIYYYLAECYYNLGDQEKTEHYIQKTIETNDGYYDYDFDFDSFVF
jgi:tetratricopeptide (TPR) repeat protein